MKTYGQFCPLAQAAQLLCERWTLLVVRELIAGSTRFNELQRGVPLMSPSLLSRRLRQLEQAGVLERRRSAEGAAYELTDAGRELQPIVEQFGAWGHRWVRSRLERPDLDAGLLMWDMRRTVDAKQFPSRRVVVQFNYPDAPRGARDWWLVSEQGETDLCLQDPGYEVDLLIRSPLRTMCAVWTCQLGFAEARRRGGLELLGNSELQRRTPGWLQASRLSQLGAAGGPPI
jgi:DNA-binding HxlR family transcriptional regulator